MTDPYTQPHECCKKDCYFCYEMNRHTYIEFTLSVPIKKVKARSFPARKWTGCDNLKLLANIHLQSNQLGLIFTERSWHSIKCRLYRFRKLYPAYRKPLVLCEKS